MNCLSRQEPLEAACHNPLSTKEIESIMKTFPQSKLGPDGVTGEFC